MMLAELAAMRLNLEKWTDADFPPVVNAIDDLFRMKGWIV